MPYQPPNPIQGPDFLQQFMAGWSMGQQRKEQQRRDQMLQAQIQQDEQDRQLRMEQLKLAQNQAKVEQQQLEFEGKAKQAALLSRMQQVQPPESMDLGDGARLDLGPAMQPRAPIMAQVPGTQGPEVPLPFREDLQEAELAAQQARMREALGMLGAQEEIKRSTEAKYRKPEPSIAEIEAEYAARARGTRTGNPPEQRGLSQTAEATVIGRLTKDWEGISQTTREIRRQYGIMESGLEAARRGDMAAGSQAVLVTFQKVLDPTSVVRESEYARSSAGLALLARIKGAAEQLAKGGAGVPVAELDKFASLAKEFLRKSEESIAPVKERIGRTADRYGIPRDVIFEDSGSAGSSGDESWVTINGVRVREKR